MRVIAPLEPEEVCSVKIFAAAGAKLAALMFPLAVRVRLPAEELTAKLAIIFAEAPVVVIEKSPPTVDVPILRAPEFVTLAVPVLVLLTVKVEAAV